MRTEEISIPAGADLTGVEAALERCFEAAGLHVAMKATLVAHKGSIHWHLKRGKERGTLEVTLWPARRRLWLNVHANRGGRWIEDGLAGLKEAIQVALRSGGATEGDRPTRTLKPR